MSNTETYMQDSERHSQMRKELGAGNKTAVFDALVAAKITEVHVEFNGEGDSGQIEVVTAMRNGESIPMPEATVTLRQASFGSTEPVISECSLREAIETLCYDFLEDELSGWENNDGSSGDFCFDVEERTVDLEFHTRYTDYINSHHSF